MSNQEIEQSKLAQNVSYAERVAEENIDGVSRRRLFKAGLATAPVVLTLASRPVLACHCQTTSTAASANLSQPTRGTVNYSGAQNILFWKVAGNWPSLVLSSLPSGTSTKFKYTTVSVTNVFNTSPKYTGAAGPGLATLLEVLNGTATPAPTQFDQDLIVALLNLLKDSTAQQCLSIAQLSQMFKGTFKPNSGTTNIWSQPSIQYYLDQSYLLGDPPVGRPKPALYPSV